MFSDESVIILKKYIPKIKVQTARVEKSPKIMKRPLGKGLSIIIELKKIYAKKEQQNIIIKPDSVGQI